MLCRLFTVWSLFMRVKKAEAPQELHSTVHTTAGAEKGRWQQVGSPASAPEISVSKCISPAKRSQSVGVSIVSSTPVTGQTMACNHRKRKEHGLIRNGGHTGLTSNLHQRTQTRVQWGIVQKVPPSIRFIKQVTGARRLRNLP